MEENPAGIEVLSDSDCWTCLRQVSVGRLAVALEDGPDIFPVNYTPDHGIIVFRTGSGTKLAAVEADARVALEADGVDPEAGIAWSVVIRGQAELVKRPDDVLESFSLPLFPWQEGQKDQFVRITPTTISGRRFPIAEPKTWWTPGTSGRTAVE